MKYTIPYFLVFLLLSCRHNFERPTWETDIDTPLIYSSLDFTNIINDSIIKFDTLNDNSLNLLFQKIISYSFDSLINLKPISTTKNVKLETISFSNTTVTNSVTLGNLISSIDFGTHFIAQWWHSSYSSLLRLTK